MNIRAPPVGHRPGQNETLHLDISETMTCAALKSCPEFLLVGNRSCIVRQTDEVVSPAEDMPTNVFMNHIREERRDTPLRVLQSIRKQKVSSIRVSEIRSVHISYPPFSSSDGENMRSMRDVGETYACREWKISSYRARSEFGASRNCQEKACCALAVLSISPLRTVLAGWYGSQNGVSPPDSVA